MNREDLKKWFVRAIEAAVDCTNNGYQLTETDKETWFEDFLSAAVNGTKMRDLEFLQKLQKKYLGKLDIQIETRCDHLLTMVFIVGRGFGKTQYIHKLFWNRDNSNELLEIENECERLGKFTIPEVYD